MRKKYLLATLRFVAILCLFQSLGFAQIGFEKTYLLNQNPPFYNYPEVTNFRMNNDTIVGLGGAWLSGDVTTSVVTKLDTSGKLIWLKDLEDANDLYQFQTFDIYPTGSNYLLCGKTVGLTATGCGTGCSEPASWGAVMDAHGNILTAKTFSPSIFGYNQLNCNKPLPAAGGGAYAFVGYMYGENVAECNGGYITGSGGEQGLAGEDIMLIKTDASLDTTFTMRFSLDFPFLCAGVDPSDSTASETVSTFLVTSTGFVFCGYRNESNTSYTSSCNNLRQMGFILSTDFNGNVNFAHTYSNPGTCQYEVINDIIQDAGGNYIAIGISYAANTNFIMRINAATGATMWCNTYSGAILSSSDRLSVDANDGNYIVGGEATSPPNGSLLMYKIDINGNVISSFTKAIGQAGWDYGAIGGSTFIGGGTPLQNSKGTYFMMGNIDHLGSSDGFMMAKLNKTLYTSGCNESTGPITSAPFTLTVRTPVVNKYRGLIIAAAQTITVADYTNQTDTTTICTVNPFTVAATPVTNVNCFGTTTGSASVTASGGNPIYTYSWSSGSAATSSSNVNVATGLGNGTYTVTVTDGAGATATSTATITQPASAVSASATAVDPNCSNGTGSASVSPAGGTPGYSYLWTTAATGQTESGLAAGSYTITVTDDLGCTTTASVSIVLPNPVTASASAVTANCNLSDGSVSVIPGGGSGGYHYAWSPGGAASQTVSALAANTYVVTVTDSKGCTATSSAVVENAAGPGALIQSSSAVSCFGGNNGEAAVSASGGTPNYAYSWSPSGGTGATANNLTANTYTVVVTDANGCTASSTQIVSQPAAALAPNPTSVNASCGTANGSVSASATGGTPGYFYNWNTGPSGATVTNLLAGSYTVTVTDSHNCTQSAVETVNNAGGPVVTATELTNAKCNLSNEGSASASVTGGTGTLTWAWSTGPSGTGSTITSSSGLTAGIYTISVTDANNCLGSSTVVITAPTAIAPTVSASANITCFGAGNGTATAAATGGTPGYIYNWNGGTPGASGLVTGLSPGTYSVTITDINGCTAITSVSLTQPAVITPSVTSTPASCGSLNGVAVASASGGTGTYAFTWNNLATGPTASNLAAGNYTVTITDGNSCTATTVTSVSNTGAGVLAVTGSQTICIGQAATLTANVVSGTAPFTYSWSGGLSGSTNLVSPTATTTWSVSATDSTGCASPMQTITVTVDPPLGLTASTGGLSVCSGSSLNLTAVGSGGNGGPYTYNWAASTGGGFTGSPWPVSPTINTSYTVTITDNCSPPVTAVIPVTVNPLPNVSMTSGAAAGCGVPFCVNFTGTPSISCSTTNWNFGDGDSSNTAGLTPNHCYKTPGVYTVSFSCTDANGCSATTASPDMITVLAKPKAMYTYAPSPVVAGIQVNFTNTSTGASNYVWRFNDPHSTDSLATTMDASHTFQDSGKYCVLLVAFDNTCLDTTINCFEVNQACHLSDSIPNVFTPNNDGINDIFTFKNTGLQTLTCTLFNRWGMEIYSYNAINSGWDGRTYGEQIAPVGTYYYILSATCVDGTQKQGHGFVEVLR